MWPMAYAIVSTVSPNASDTPSRPIPTLGNAADRTALPHPPNTSQNVPINSAIDLLPKDMVTSPSLADALTISGLRFIEIVVFRILGALQGQLECEALLGDLIDPHILRDHRRSRVRSAGLTGFRRGVRLRFTRPT